MPDCGCSSCRYAPRPRRGMRTNGGCRCDECPMCGAFMRPGSPGAKHYARCTTPDWVPSHHVVNGWVIRDGRLENVHTND